MNTRRLVATRLREDGYSYKMIHEQTGVPISTLSNWFSSQPFTPNLEVIDRIKRGPMISGMKKHSEKMKRVGAAKAIGYRDVGEMSDRDLFMLGIGLYLGEGSKSIEAIRIANSDAAVIVIAMAWLMDCCGVPVGNLSARLHLYPDNNEADAKKYWSQITGLPLSSFQKSSIDKRENKLTARRRTLPHGTIHLSVRAYGDKTKGVALFHRVMAWIESVQDQISKRQDTSGAGGGNQTRNFSLEG